MLVQIAIEMVDKLSHVKGFADREGEELFQLYSQYILSIRRTLRHAEAQARLLPTNTTAHLEWLIYDTDQAIASQTVTDLGDIVNIANSYKRLTRKA